MLSAKRLTLSQAIDGMLFYKKAANKSPNTIASYRYLLDKLRVFFAPDDPEFASITRERLVEFFAWLQDGYVSPSEHSIVPHHIDKLSPKTLLDIHSTVSALWGWAVKEELIERNIVRSIEAPEAEPPVIETFTKEQVEAMLKACDRTGVWKGRELTASARPTAERDRAIILLLFDSGLRATELCNIQRKDINLQTNTIKVLGKGAKERVVYFGKRTAKAIWRYLLPRLNTYRMEDYVFVVDYPRDPRPMDRRILQQLLRRIGDRAGIPHVHPHRFRHSMAINYLRNGGDVLTLQALLGHSSLETVSLYTRIAQTDCARVHQSASPVDNWKL